MVDSRHFRLLTLFLGLTLASSASADEGAIVQELDRYLSAVSKTTPFSGSVLVAKDGEILVRAGYGLASRELDVPNTAATRYRIGSLTKTVSALGILQLCDKGALSLADPLSKFLPKFPRGDQISVEHLLNHTSGLPPSWREDWHEKRQLDLAEVIDLFKDSPPVAPPGQEEHYSNPGYAVLANHQSANVFDIADNLTAILAGRGYHLPKVRSAVKLDPELSTQYAGEYEFESGEGFQILSLNGRLFVESHGDPPEEIFPANGGEFFSRLHDLQIRFALDTDHKVEGALWTYRGEQVKARKID